jgi:hypothetical protein
VLVEEAKETPDADAGAIVVLRFNIYSAFLDLGGSSLGCTFPEATLGFDVAVKYAVFCSLVKVLVV